MECRRLASFSAWVSGSSFCDMGPLFFRDWDLSERKLKLRDLGRPLWEPWEMEGREVWDSRLAIWGWAWGWRGFKGPKGFRSGIDCCAYWTGGGGCMEAPPTGAAGSGWALLLLYVAIMVALEAERVERVEVEVDVRRVVVGVVRYD